MTTEEKIKSFILENFLFTDDESAIGNEESLLDRGVIDSTGVMEVILFLEEEFGVQVQDDEIIPENLDSISNIKRFVESKVGA
ncbi:MAG TPA: acyl carrier protein [Gammaproteobacteria bacterium]|nr:acyl carrier protein [Gammaproteobacteria bacterium]